MSVAPDRRMTTRARTLSRRVLLLGLALGLAGCSASLPETPMLPDQDFTQETVEAPGILDDPPAAFALLPGDVVRLRTISVDPLDVAELIVDARGVLDVPMAGEIAVGGLSTSEATREIEAGLHRYDRFARASLTVTDPGGHTATVVGAVERPGSIALRTDTRLAEVLAIAGGGKVETNGGELVELADLDAATIVRGGQALPVRMSRALRGDTHHNVRVQPGDVVFVPSTAGRMITVLGEVGQPKTVPFRTGIRLTTVLAMAGGMARSADHGDVRVIRGSLASPKVYRTDFGALMDGQTHDVELAAGDIIYVGTDTFWSITEVMNRLMPGLAAASLAMSFAR